MVNAMNAEQARVTVAALRYVLWCQDNEQWLAAGADPDEEPLCPLLDGDPELAYLPLALAGLVIAARRALAGLEGAADQAEQSGRVRAYLLHEIESHEMSAAFAAIEAEHEDSTP